ncbi:MAG: helicase-related protein [Sedimentisphaerales bacterium]
MTAQFITNQNKLLSDVINNILPCSRNLYFLVGYFYFSGFQEIYEKVADKNLKILVGLEVERDLTNKVKEFEMLQEVNISRGQIRDNYYKSLVQLFNDTDFFDTPKKVDAFKLFLGKIENGTLEIRKTFHPNHAKLYVFENEENFNQGGEYPGTVITGSSNLTRAGLKDRFEINVVSRDLANYQEAYKIFQELWKDSVKIVDKDNLDDFFYNVVEKTWLNKSPSPFLLYIRVLNEYFRQYKADALRLPSKITDGEFLDLKYQIDAIGQAIDTIQKHNGVIIADVVGLGKSIIASTVAHNLNLRTIIISPPHLIDQWEDYHYDFKFHAKIYSSGKIEQALEENDKDEQKLIIIDEAHKYRNELTADYGNLHKLCQRNKIILLSATPFNNKPQDIFSMVRLFQIPTRTTLQTVDNLSYQFRELIVEYKRIKEAQKKKSESEIAISARINKVAEKIRNMLSPLVIRRSRLDLDAIDEYKKDLEQQNITFPKVNPPQELEYELGNLSGLYLSTLEQIAPEDEESAKGFIGARYMPTNYIKDFEKYRQKIVEEMGVDENLYKQIQINLAQFMRRLLVRRFESSIFAFQTTLDNIIKSSETILEWYEKLGKVPVYKKGKLPDIESIIEVAGEDLDDELEENLFDYQLRKHIEKGLWFIDKKEIKKGFVEDVQRDIEVLNNIKQQWFGSGFPTDPKLEHFKTIVKERLKIDPSRKIVVFSEFADTVNYLYDKLKDELKVFKYTAKDSSQTNKQVIKQNFDAASKIQKNDFDVLIATDAISEGFNLHRAGIVFNYDIPYNPTRVIQRVGRINRINKKVFDELFIYNFFPTETGEEETRVKQVSTLKLAMVHALFGEDTKYLTKDEELRSFFAAEYQRAIAAGDELSPETKYENFIRNLRANNKEIVEEAAKLPKRCRIKRTVKKEQSGVIVFGKKGDEYVFKIGSKTKEPHNLPIADALKLFEAEINETGEKTSNSFYEIYSKISENLFAKRTEVAKDRGKLDTIAMIEALKDKLPQHKDYLEDLLFVVKELDALPERFARLIRAIELNKLEKDFNELKRQVPLDYLLSIIEREQKIEDGKETLILSEELI